MAQSEEKLEIGTDKISIIKRSGASPQNKYQFLFKVSLIGSSGIGKSSILVRFTEDQFRDETNSTIGVDFKIVSVQIGNSVAKMQIWDTCGSERFKSLTASYLKSCNVFILIFDITSSKSFADLDGWMDLITNNTNPKFACLVGNKIDLEDQRQVTSEEILTFSQKHNMKYMETSAKANENIENLFLYVTELLYKDSQKKSRFCPNEELIDDLNTFSIGCERNIEKENPKSGYIKKGCGC